MALRKIAFVLEDFIVGAPSQQLLDRFLIGYARDGEFRRIPDLQIAVWLAPAPENSSASFEAATSLAIRERDLKLVQAHTLESVLQDADAVVVVASVERVCVSEELLKKILEQAPLGIPCFVHGCLATTFAAAWRLTTATGKQKIILTSGTSVATTFRLPDIELSHDTPLAEALIVVQGPQPMAELWAIDGLAPIIAQWQGSETFPLSVHRFDGRGIWRAGDKSRWPLLAAAISRSNTVQGDPVKDGRTQDIIGLNLAKKLAREPRGWIIEHANGLRSTILVLDGVVADFNFAVRSRDGAITSAQLYRPPAPNRAEFDRLVAVLEGFFVTRKAPWPIERSLLVSQFMEKVAL
jgi:hypothetical protein